MSIWLGYLASFAVGGGLVGVLAYVFAPKVDRDKRQDVLEAPKRQHRMDALKSAEAALQDAIAIVSKVDNAAGPKTTLGYGPDRVQSAASVSAQLGNVGAYAPRALGAYMQASNDLSAWAKQTVPLDGWMLTFTLQDASRQITEAIRDIK